ncbi:MAG: hypothetical protein IPM64_02715 [Phycisphaerales bacterium]|nr:hypothetical protein [Phycisphaerales bacterium]
MGAALASPLFGCIGLVSALLLGGLFALPAVAAEPEADLVRSLQKELDVAVNGANPASSATQPATSESGASDAGESRAARAKQVARGLQSLAAEHGSTAELEQLTATAHHLAGDMGRAVLHLRRAQRLAPGDSEIHRGLEFLRSQIEGAARPPDHASWIPAWLDLHGRTSLRVRGWIALGGGIVGFGALGIWLLKRRPGLLVTAVLGGTAWGGAGASLLVQLQAERQTPAAVVVEPQLVRSGRGETYEAMRAAPLPAGSEIVIRETRAGWVRLSLMAGETGWIPEQAIERVIP